MTPLLWDAIPAGAVVLAIVSVAWARRTRRPAQVAETVDQHTRFRAALRQASRPRSSAGSPDPGPPAAAP